MSMLVTAVYSVWCEDCCYEVGTFDTEAAAEGAANWHDRWAHAGEENDA